MNTWNITGIVKNFGVKGQQYKKLWIAVDVHNSIKSSTVFVNFDLDSNPASKKFKIGDYVNSTLAKDKNICVYDMTVSMIKHSKLKEDKTWETEERVGLKANISNITFLDNPNLQVNIGFLKGKVINQGNNKLIVEQSYLIPKENVWKTRPIPVLIDPNIEYMFNNVILTGKQVFINGQIVGTEKALYVLAKQLIIL